MQTTHMGHQPNFANAKHPPAEQDSAQAIDTARLAVDGSLGTVESGLLGDILRQLVRDVEMPVRRALARQLSTRDDAPHDLIVLLANDVIDVAYPILVKSDILEDQDLIDVITRRARQHALAVTKRKNISPSVGDALVATGDTEVMVSLLRNDNAELHAKTLDVMVDESQTIEALQEPLLGRKDLNIDIAIRMTDWVGESLRRFIGNRFDIKEENLRAAVSDAVLEAIDDDIFGDVEWSAANSDASASGPGADLLDALSHDNIARFKETFEKMIRLPSHWAERSLYPSVEALAIASRAVGLNVDTYTRILCHLHSRDIYDLFCSSPLYARMVTYFDAIDQTSAAAILDGWRKNKLS